MYTGLLVTINGWVQESLILRIWMSNCAVFRKNTEWQSNDICGLNRAYLAARYEQMENRRLT